MKMNYPALRREWLVCPYCGQRVAIFENNALCTGVYVRCKRCRREFEIRIADGKQNA